MNNRKQAVDSGRGDLELILGILLGTYKAFMVVSVLVLCVVAAYVFTLPNMYRAKAAVMDAEDSTGGSVGISSQLGGLASLAGVNIGGGNEKFQLAKEIVKTRGFVLEVINKYDLKPLISAVIAWDVGSGIVFDGEIYNSTTSSWIDSEPNDLWLYNEFSDRFKISEDKSTGFLNISFDHESPYVAVKVLQYIVLEINEKMKSSDISEARDNISYLNAEIDKTAVSSMRNVFYQLVEEQSKKLMLASVKKEYVFKLLDEIYLPQRPSSPKRVMVILVSGVLIVFFYLLFLAGLFFKEKYISGLMYEKV